MVIQIIISILIFAAFAFAFYKIQCSYDLYVKHKAGWVFYGNFQTLRDVLNTLNELHDVRGYDIVKKFKN